MSRLRANEITNRMANGAPTASNGLVISGVSTHVGLSQFQNTINLTHASAGQNYIYFNEDLQFAKNGTGTRVKIDSGGRVLIGETSVAGSAPLCVGNGGQELFEFTPGSSTYNGGLIEYIHRGDGTTRPDLNLYLGGPSAFKVYTNATERLRIKSDGVVNIGDYANNTWIDSTLKVRKDQNAVTKIAVRNENQGSSASAAIVVNSYGNSWMFDCGSNAKNSNALTLRVDATASSNQGTERFRVTTDGKVKIGNSGGTPDGKLHIDEIGNGDIVAELTSGSPMFTYRNGTNAWFHAGKHPSDDAFVVTQGGTTTATELLRITSAGRIGIGENSPDGMLHLTGSVPAIFLEDTSGTHGQTIIEQNNDNLKIRCDAGNASSGTTSNIRFEVDATERLRIQSNNGDILFGNYLGGGTNQPRVFFLSQDGNFPDQSNRIGLRISNGYNDASIRAYSNNDGWSHVKFYSTHLSGGTIVTSGSITQSGGNTISYNTSSDYRLKENEVLISDGITRLKQLKPYRFNWKTDTSKKVDGFYAHEVSGIVPDAVTGEKDAVVTQAMIDAGEIDEAIGTPVYQQMDHAKLVPLITAALQETVAKIETLETKVETLEQDNELLRKKVLENVVRIVNLENDSHEH